MISRNMVLKRPDAGHRIEDKKLTALKDQIRDSVFPVRENYQDARELGEWVLSDLAAIIDRLYPEGSQPDPLDREAADLPTFKFRTNSICGAFNF
jgi:hypothetical protein